jgi:hypothetical protein
MAMSNRKLVQIPLEYHERLTKLQEGCAARGEPVPTIPDLVKFAIASGLPAVIERYEPKAKEQPQ